MNFNEKKNCVKSQGIGVSLDQSFDMHHERFTNLCTIFTHFYRRDFTNFSFVTKYIPYSPPLYFLAKEQLPSIKIIMIHVFNTFTFLCSV